MTREIADSTQPCKTAAGPALPNPPLSALVHMTKFRLRLSVSVINLSFGSLLIRQQLLLLLCNWDTLPGATGQHPTQHTMEWQGVFTLVSAHPLEGERPTAHAAHPPPSCTEPSKAGPGALISTSITPVPAHGHLLHLLLPLAHRWVALKDVASLLHCSLSESSVSLILLLEPSWIPRFKCTSQGE